MKTLIFQTFFNFFCFSAFALGDPSALPNDTPMADTTAALNQVSKDPQAPPVRQEPQDMQETLYQEQQAREKEEWENQKRHSDFTQSEEFSNE